LLIPLIKKSTQKRISEKIKKANEFIMDSKKYLENSKEMVQMEIEKLLK